MVACYVQYSYNCKLPYIMFHILLFFFFNDTATTEIYTLSLHDALPISTPNRGNGGKDIFLVKVDALGNPQWNKIIGDRKSTRLNSSHSQISYAVFCLKKKKKKQKEKKHNISKIKISIIQNKSVRVAYLL